MRLGGEDRQRRVVAHREARLLGLPGHRPDDELDVLGGEAGRRLTTEEVAGLARACGRLARRRPRGRLVRRGRRRRLTRRGRPVARRVAPRHVERLRRQTPPLGEQPGAVGAAGRDGGLDDVVAQQPTVPEVDGDHLAGSEAALLDDLLAGQRDGAGLRSEREQAGAGARVARRAQAVAVDAGAGVPAVGEGDQRRPVPRLLHAGVVVVEVGDARVAGGARARTAHSRAPSAAPGTRIPAAGPAGGLLLVGGRHRHHERLERAAAAAHQQLDELVERARVAAVGVYRRQQLGDARAPDRSGQLRLAGAHPGEVAEQRVDLAVVGEQPHRLRQAPLRRRVRAEAAVQHREWADKAGVLEVRIELGQHGRRDHALVDDRPRRERAHVEVVEAADDGLAHERPADGPAGQEQGAFQLVAGEHRRGRDDLLHVRVALADARRKRLRPQRHGTPADDHEALVTQRLGDELAGEVPLALLPRQEDHADRGRERPRLGDPLVGEPRLEHLPGDRREDAGAVRGFAVGADAAAMLHRGEGAEGELHHLT